MQRNTSQAYLPGFDAFELLFGDVTVGQGACVPPAAAPSPIPPNPPSTARAADSAPIDIAAADQGVQQQLLIEVELALEESTPLEMLPAAEAQEVLAEGHESEPLTTLAGDALLANLSDEVPASLVQRSEAPWPTQEFGLAETLTTEGKFAANLNAIKLLNELDATGRAISPDERSVLMTFSGWGPVPDVFTGNYAWKSRQEQLRDALGEERYGRASSAVTDSFYTPVWLIKAVWQLVQHLGFSNGRVLDPSAGTGGFFGSMPQELLKACEMHAVEIDPTSAGIAKHLYGSAATVHNAGFESVRYPSDYFDLALSNVPFGDYRVACANRKPYSPWSIHNYFVSRMLDLVRPGGLVIAIASSYLLDGTNNANTEIRAYLHRRARLLGAIRLPQGTFKQSSGTHVGADLIVLQRRQAWEVPEPDEAPWSTVGMLPDVATHLPVRSREINEYFVARREMGLGTWGAVRGQYGERIGLTYTGQNLQRDAETLFATLPALVYTEPAAKLATVKAVGTSCGMSPGSYLVSEGMLCQSDGHGLQPVDIRGTRAQRMLGLIGIRDLLQDLLTKQSDKAVPTAETEQLRKRLNIRYDAFIHTHGFLRDTGNARVFRQDPSWPLLLSLELWDEETKTAKKADVFHRNTGSTAPAPVKADSLADAVLISMAELGRVDCRYIARLTGRDEEDREALRLAMEREGVAFEDPVSRQLLSAGEYLSGQVRAKLADAMSAGPRYAAGAAALESVIPQDLTPGQIEVRLGAVWVPASDYIEFVKQLTPAAFSSYSEVKIEVDHKTAAWTVDLRGVAGDFEVQWAGGSIDGVQILRECFNGRSVTAYDVHQVDGRDVSIVNIERTAAAREKQALLHQQFADWIWADDERATRLARVYNDNYNSWVDRQYDGSRMRLPGYSWCLQPSPHQLNGASRAATGKNTLLGHVVGAGKTLTMQIAAMEMRRLGLRRKPCHVVPNHMLEQYTSEFLQAYPAAKVLMISKEDLSADKRKLFTAKIALGDWDSIVLTHAVFEKIAPPPGLTEHYIQTILAEVEAMLGSTQKGAANRTALKMAKKAKREWEAKLESLRARWKRDDLVTLDMLGIDHICVDEAHYFKNLIRLSQMDRVAGLNDSNSQRAFDMFVKTRAIMAIHGDRQEGITFATGTFVANSIAEMHVMQRYLQPNSLAAAGLESFDAWARMFGRVVTSLEVSPDGGSFRMNNRFAQFVNVPELMAMFAEVADIKTKSMLKLPTPAVAGGGPQVIAVPASPKLKAYVQELVERAEAIRSRAVDPATDNMLKVTGDGRKAALDIRLVMPDAEFECEGKIAALVDNAHKLWLESASFRGAQCIFSDLGTPSSARTTSVYHTIRSLLIAKGVPAQEIAFIHDADTDTAKARLLARVREGGVRFILGSTSKLGVGTNMQTRLYALHHLDSPWRPADVEQREGRIERRGNTCEFIYIFRYVTQGSFDAYMWQTLAAKAAFIDQVMSGDRSLRKVEDLNSASLSYEEVKAIACGNPLVREKALLDNELRRLSLLETAYRRGKSEAQWQLRTLPERRLQMQQQQAAIEADLAVVSEQAQTYRVGEQDVPETDFWVTLAEYYQDIHESPKAVHAALQRCAGKRMPIGSVKGLAVCISTAQRWSDPAGPEGLILRIGNKFVQSCYPFRRASILSDGVAKLLNARHEDLQNVIASLKSLDRQELMLEQQAQAEFEHAGKIAELEQAIFKIEVELGMVKDEAGTTGLAEDAEVASEAAREIAQEHEAEEEEAAEA